MKIIKEFEGVGYNISYKLVNAKDFGVPQERKRVIVVGYRKETGKTFSFPQPSPKSIALKEALKGLPDSKPALPKNKPNEKLGIPNHEHMVGGFSTIYMSRNRRRSWDEPSFTIQAGGRHAPLHPGSAKMIKKGADDWKFEESTYREALCARVRPRADFP